MTYYITYIYAYYYAVDYAIVYAIYYGLYTIIILGFLMLKIYRKIFFLTSYVNDKRAFYHLLTALLAERRNTLRAAPSSSIFLRLDAAKNGKIHPRHRQGCLQPDPPLRGLRHAELRFAPSA